MIMHVLDRSCTAVAHNHSHDRTHTQIHTTGPVYSVAAGTLILAAALY